MTRQNAPDAAKALEDLGFTALEARIYVELLRGGPLTGYRIAQQVGKAAANTYKALDALAARGVVACEDGRTRLYRATPYAEVAATLAAEFSRRSRAATGALAALEGERGDDRIYRLQDGAQIYERARSLLSAAKAVAVIDAFPEAIETIASEIETAAARGVTVTVHAYAPTKLRGARVVIAPRAPTVREQWPGTWLNVCIDGASALIAHLIDEEQTVGVWTENAHVAWTIHSGLASEAAMAGLAELAQRKPQTPLADALRGFDDLMSSNAPGRTALVSKLSKKKGLSR